MADRAGRPTRPTVTDAGGRHVGRRGRTPLARRRPTSRRLAATTWDVVIVGGGIVGPGALLDAVSRGLRAALIEQDDIAAGTSSRSSRLIHGGLRYLEQFRFGLVREALAERSRLLALAPHLVRIEPLLFPIYGIPFASKAFYDAGLTLYDLLGARHDGGWHRPAVEGRDARPGADPATRRPARRAALPRRGRGRRALHAGRGPDRDRRRRRWRSPGSARPGLRAAPSGAIEAVVARRTSRPARRSRSATRAVVDATGVWAAEPGHPFGGGSLRILPSRGAHLVVPPRADPEPDRADDPGPGQDRVPRPVARPLADRHDRRAVRRTARPTRRPRGWEVDQLLDTVNATMDVDLTRDDVVGTYAGLRPLDRAVRRLDGQGVARAPGHGRGRTASSGSAAASTRPTG